MATIGINYPTYLDVAKRTDPSGQIAAIVEIITHVAMNILTNLIGKATQVDIDFPKVALQAQAA